ncbi:MAG: hypothetical protein IT377_30010 [Polyangiaceae bacterium]|nr:hypothetical protein [Polyangiaceae bacterium]
MRIRALGLLVGALATAFASDANAVGERWYMMQNCGPSGPTYSNWVMNAYGFINLDDTYVLRLTCAQPHLVGSNGYDQSRAKVFDRNWTTDVIGELCRSDGGAGPAVCDFEQSVAALSSPIMLTFDPIVDSLSYYYWTWQIPDYDPSGPSGGYSGVVSMYFDDN